MSLSKVSADLQPIILLKVVNIIFLLKAVHSSTPVLPVSSESGACGPNSSAQFEALSIDHPRNSDTSYRELQAPLAPVPGSALMVSPSPASTSSVPKRKSTEHALEVLRYSEYLERVFKNYLHIPLAGCLCAWITVLAVARFWPGFWYDPEEKAWFDNGSAGSVRAHTSVKHAQVWIWKLWTALSAQVDPGCQPSCRPPLGSKIGQ
ncbi:hypothetical protein LXA43DRAFT_1093994 [Ganoderma leucocontextum]|nr:hypothetical protein LXA43DRAFT_1093994 [Ganoderma leucocontextum]